MIIVGCCGSSACRRRLLEGLGRLGLLDELQSERAIGLLSLTPAILFDVRASALLFQLLGREVLLWSIFRVTFPLDPILVTVEGDLKRAVLQDNVAARYANVEASLAAKLPYLLYQLLARVKLALQVCFDIVLEAAGIVVDDGRIVLLLLGGSRRGRVSLLLLL